MAASRTHAALLRGINVGGHAKIPMRELAELFGSLGHGEVATYIQSGNVVFRSVGGRPDVVARALEEAIARRFGQNVTVILRTPAELVSIAAANPFPEAEDEPSKLHVLFLDRLPAGTAIAGLDPDRSPGICSRRPAARSTFASPQAREERSSRSTGSSGNSA